MILKFAINLKNNISVLFLKLENEVHFETKPQKYFFSDF